MKKLNYKLIVSDFDGTLIDDNQQILPDVRNAIKNYIACGGVFAVCTGRMTCCILPRVRELGLKGLVVAYQGTVIADIESGKILKSGGIESEGIAEICRNIKELGHPVNVYSGDELYTDIPKNNEYLQRYERIVGIDAQYVEEDIAEFVLKRKLFCQKVAILVAHEEQAALYAELSRRLSGKYDVTCSAKVLVEISPLNDNKGEAVKFLANEFGIPIEKTVAVGDNLNDLSMIKAAGIGVAVGNATEALKNAADFISVSNNEGAVAEVIEKFGFLNE
ncbi:MAG: Cof-type HAD-IIB family hydrolase [Clostridia bacterium]|nr:Cof-type HAD-IIB family hydrolase [Clostridia bacterium]